MLASKQLLSGLAMSLFLLGTSSNAALSAPKVQQPEQVAQRGDRGGPGGRRGDFLEQLNLSEAQMQDIREIRERYGPDLQELHGDIRSERDQLRQLMAGSASESEIRSQHSRVLNLHQEMAETRFDSMLEIRNVLTPEQRQEWAELVEQRRDEFGRGPREGGGTRR